MNDPLHERIARALGWPVADTYTFSMQSLRELVRGKNPKLADEISIYIQSCLYIVGKKR